MKSFVTLIASCGLAFFVACATNDKGDDTTPPDNTLDCRSDDCVCPSNQSCEHTCADGSATCHVQGTPGEAVDVKCRNNGDCHVECANSPTCKVDCGGSADCHVTCPASGCTVNNCVGTDCQVTCGLVGAATHSGSTATCP